jgi:hypothetical protein
MGGSSSYISVIVTLKQIVCMRSHVLTLKVKAAIVLLEHAVKLLSQTGGFEESFEGFGLELAYLTPSVCAMNTVKSQYGTDSVRAERLQFMVTDVRFRLFHVNKLLSWTFSETAQHQRDGAATTQFPARSQGGVDIVAMEKRSAQSLPSTDP